MRIAIAILVSIVGIIGTAMGLMVTLLVFSMVLSELVSAQTFGYYFRPFAVLVLVCAGPCFGWWGYTLTRGAQTSIG